jgi:hypothetical protein
VEKFVGEGDPLVVGIDEILERRYGRKISAKGAYPDPVRSTHETFVESSGGSEDTGPMVIRVRTLASPRATLLQRCAARVALTMRYLSNPPFHRAGSPQGLATGGPTEI